MNELFRKCIHLLWFVVYLVYSYLESLNLGLGLFFLFVFFLLWLFLDMMRVDWKHRFWFSRYLHTSERYGLSTPTVTLLGMLLSFALFPSFIALPAVLMMIFGDFFSGVGDMFGSSTLLYGKTVLGFSLGLVVNVCIGWFYLGYVGLVMACVASIVEMCSVRINDNLTIPLFAGLVTIFFF